MHIQNLHTHSTYCDGKNTPEEMIVAAIDKGFDSIGFSGHSYMVHSPMFAKNRDLTEEYRKEVLKLREKYKAQIKIFLGLEVEMFSNASITGYDYLIGSLHYFKIGDEYVGFDRYEEDVERIINTYFDGNGMKYAKVYYETLAQLPQYGDFDIIGHFDLITKHSEKRKFFDETSKEYLDAAFETAEVLAKKIPFFEVNTGAISRGYRKTPYPSIPIIKRLKELGFGAVITSDCHDRESLDCNFDEATEILKLCGFKEKYIFTEEGFTAVSL